MLKKTLSILCLVLPFSSPTYAFTCYLTMVKDSCWQNYDLTVNGSDTATGNVIVTVSVPKGKAWERTKFDCNNGQTLSLEAQFSPVFWKGEENKKYPAQRFWKLPQAIESGVTGWNITVCYPKWFSDVPAPPEASENCKCSTDNIPAVAPLKE